MKIKNYWNYNSNNKAEVGNGNNEIERCVTLYVHCMNFGG
jgi:hypothetical protein